MNTFDRNGLLVDDMNNSEKWNLANAKTVLSTKKSMFSDAFQTVKSAFSPRDEKKEN